MRRAQGIAERIAAERGLPLLQPIRADVLSRRGLVDLVRRKMREETPPEELRAEGVLLERLGMLEDAGDYEEVLYGMLEEQIAGLYDPDDKTLYVLDDMSLAETDLTLWHEIVHALQDQNFHVGERQDELKDDGDRAFAYSAICEGDAVITSTALQTGGWDALRWALPRDLESLRMMVVGLGPPGDVPAALLDLLAFPYIEGVAFVRAHYDRGGVRAIDDLFRRPPLSTEQVIHPEKYGGPDVPVPVRLPAALAALPGHSPAYQDTLGEFIVRVWLALYLPRPDAEVAAAGWGGDRVALMVPAAAPSLPADCIDGATPLDPRLWSCGASPRCGDEPAGPDPTAESQGWLVWTTVWDPPPADGDASATAEAEQFFEAARDAFARRLVMAPSAGSSCRDDHDTCWTARDARTAVALRRSGRLVHVVVSPQGAVPDPLAVLDELAGVAARSAHPDE